MGFCNEKVNMHCPQKTTAVLMLHLSEEFNKAT